MSILDPLACGFAKIATYTLFTSKQDIEKQPGECSAKFKSRELTHKYYKFQECFGDQSFQIEYKQFINNFPKIVNNISTFAEARTA